MKRSVHLLVWLSVVFLLIDSPLCVSFSSSANPTKQTDSWLCVPFDPPLSSSAPASSATIRPTGTPNKMNRRRLLGLLGASLALVQQNSCAAAQDGDANKIALILNAVPTFTIVDASGAPYMVVGEDAKPTGYFFISYLEADRILKLAKTSADKSLKEANEPLSDNPWKLARISTISLDTAVSLSLNSALSKTYFQVAASSSDIEDAMDIDQIEELAEGKVPLFYFPDFELDGGSPLYFTKKQLETDFKKHNKQTPLPQPSVTELFAVLQEMAKDNPQVASVYLVPPENSDKYARQCEKKGGTAPPILLGERNVVL